MRKFCGAIVAIGCGYNIQSISNRFFPKKKKKIFVAHKKEEALTLGGLLDLDFYGNAEKDKNYEIKSISKKKKSNEE